MPVNSVGQPAQAGPDEAAESRAGTGPDDPADVTGTTLTTVAQAPPKDTLDRRRRGGPVELFMSTVIRKLSGSRLTQPRVAVTISGIGLLLSMIVGATAPNVQTMGIKLPLSALFPSIRNVIVAGALTYSGVVLAGLGLAGMLWANSQGWRPDPRKLLLASAGIVAVMVSLTPVGSSDTASYAMYGRISMQGGNPYRVHPVGWAQAHGDIGYIMVVGNFWKRTPSVYGPFATVVQAFAAWIGGSSVATTIWILMILNGLVFIGVGWLLLKTSDDPVRATLLWTANPVLILELVSGGHLDTFVAAAAICAIQVARKVSGNFGDVLIGVMIGLACAVKINAVLIGIGLAWPLLRRHEWLRTARITAVSLATVGLAYAPYGFTAFRQIGQASALAAWPSPWRGVQELAAAIAGQPAKAGWPAYHAATTIIGYLWPVAMIIVAWLIYQRISSEQPREIVAPFALCFAWVLAAPWALAWYTAIAWVTLTQVPRNRMTRWLAIVTVVLAIWRSGGGHGATGLNELV
jgi:hypothetical protein